MLAVARRLAARPEDLRADVVFLAPSVEEAGLLGSSYFVHHLPQDLEQVVANVNFEMINVWGETREVYAIGASHSTLDRICRQAAAAIGAEYIPEQDRENGFFFRSDQASFARVGVPAVWLHEGITSRGADPGHIRAMCTAYRREHYHRPTDDVAHLAGDWDLAGTVQIARWAESIVRRVAAAKAPPRFLKSSAFHRAGAVGEAARPTGR